MRQEDLSYPVICLSHDGSIISHFSSATMGACNARALWITRYYADATVLDAKARSWRIAAAEPKPPLSAAGQFIARFTNRSLQVRLQIEGGDSSSGLDDVKRRISDWLELDPVFWEASADLADWKARIAVCTSMDELARLFA